jgi:hypothetical protein
VYEYSIMMTVLRIRTIFCIQKLLPTRNLLLKNCE